MIYNKEMGGEAKAKAMEWMDGSFFYDFDKYMDGLSDVWVIQSSDSWGFDLGLYSRSS